MFDFPADISVLRARLDKNKALYAPTIVFLAILALLPFHAFFTTWLSSGLGYGLLFKSWKELLLLFITLPVLWILLRDGNRLFKVLWRRPVNKLIYLYAGLYFVLSIVLWTDQDAMLASLAMNLRFLAMFVVAQLLIELLSAQALRRLSQKIVIAGAAAVAVFGALQVFVLPVNFLEYFGYSRDTIAPYLTIDQNPDFIRISSTLRGPNPLGAYLILPILYFGWRFFKTRSWRPATGLVLSVTAMYFSYSRSAWLGVAVAIAALVIFSTQNWKKYVLIGVAVAGLGAVAIGIGLSSSEYLRNIIVHDYSEVTSGDSTSEHLRALQSAAGDITREPFGGGPGTAGPASFYNDDRQRLSENYFLQIGQEVGIVGLILFIAINVLVAGTLWAQRDRLWPRLLLASFAGLTVVSLFLHGWADETVAITWWGLAGLYQKQK